MDDIRRVKERVELDWLNRPGVTGVDIGWKIVDGEKTDQLAIRVHVEEKKDVPEDQMIPDEIDGIPTDVIQHKFVLH
jgi:hypothetical protein